MIARVGFLGTGWIGRHRMQAMLASGAVEAVAIFDPSPQCLAEAQAIAPNALALGSYETMLGMALDGVVIATPSAQHAAQSIAALRSGAAVFCQKPLSRTALEARNVVAAARQADRLLGVDLSYRHTRAMQAIVELVRSGALGRVFAVDLTFHNAYGPDKPWFYDRSLSGGGCVIDLGVHLVDLALWALGFPYVSDVHATLLGGGEPLRGNAVEDYATAQFSAGGTDVRLACSWRLNAGQDAVIEAAFYGTEGGAALRNVGGSFFDFTADHFRGTSTTRLVDPPDDWGGGAAIAWARQLAVSPAFDPRAEELVRLAEVLDDIYAAAPAMADPAVRLVGS
jgi:predicted dehydrogenase